MSKPIVTIQCYHTCPASDGSKPHVGGPTLQGSSNVFVQNKMVCRIGDQAQCNSPSIDIINSGSSSVFINGKGAARKQDQTAHGGVINEGVQSVLVG